MGRFSIAVFALCLFPMFPCRMYSHGEWVHQHQVKEAYKLLKDKYGNQDFPELLNYLGMSSSGDGGGMWQTGLVVTGAWREDTEDLVYETGGGFIGWTATAPTPAQFQSPSSVETPVIFHSSIDTVKAK